MISTTDSTSSPWSQLGSSRKRGRSEPVLQQGSYRSLCFPIDMIILSKEQAVPREKAGIGRDRKAKYWCRNKVGAGDLQAGLHWEIKRGLQASVRRDGGSVFSSVPEVSRWTSPEKLHK